MDFKHLSVSDGRDIYEMLQELPANENGFVNGINGYSFDDYKKWLIKSENIAKGVNLADWMVPQNIYWLYSDDGKPVGIGKLRHRLTEKLLVEGGHAGYAIRPSSRNCGFGKLLLKQLIVEARHIGIVKLLLTVQNHNMASISIAMANGGVIEKISEERHFIWIDCRDGQTN